MILPKKEPKVKMSIDLSQENYNSLLELKQQTQTSIGKIINLILSEHLKDTSVEEGQNNAR